jgi:hypothetical protein
MDINQDTTESTQEEMKAKMDIHQEKTEAVHALDRAATVIGIINIAL